MLSYKNTFVQDAEPTVAANGVRQGDEWITTSGVHRVAYSVQGSTIAWFRPFGSNTNAAAAGDFTLDAAGASTIGAVVNGARVANVADANLVGGSPVLHQFAIANQASGNLDWALTHKTKIVDAWIIKGAAGHATEDTIKLQNVTTDASDALAMGATASALKRFVQIVPAQQTIAAGANLRAVLVRGAGGGNNTECTLYVLGVRVA